MNEPKRVSKPEKNSSQWYIKSGEMLTSHPNYAIVMGDKISYSDPKQEDGDKDE
jgi:hypothetical protein